MRAFVIAMESEAECVRPRLRGDDLLLVSGVGKVNAAAAAQHAIDCGADWVFNLGVCGGFGRSVRPGDVCEVSSAVEYDFDLAKLNGTRRGQLNEFDSPYLALTVRGGFPARILASGDRFSDSDADWSLIEDELGAELRDMEGAAIAHVCARHGVRCSALKCVTNVARADSMLRQYGANLTGCLARLEAAAARWLED